MFDLTRRSEREQGFTLIELLVIVMIIGILAAISVPIFTKQRKYAVDATVESDVVNTAGAVEDWNIGNRGQVHAIPGADSELGRSIKMSDSNRIIVFGNSENYCIKGTNPYGDRSVEGILYSSSNGGMDGTSSCEDNFGSSGGGTSNNGVADGDIIIWEGETEKGDSGNSEGQPVNPPVENGGGAPVDPPNNNGSEVIPPVDSGNNSGGTETPNVPETAPPVSGQNPNEPSRNASCGDIEFTAQMNTYVDCEHLASNKKQDVFKVIVGSQSTTDIRWYVDLDISNMSNRVSSNLETPKAFQSTPLGGNSFRVSGKDNNGKNQPASAFVSNKKSHVFITKVTWK